MSTALTAIELATRHHRRAVRFFWGWLIGATLVSLAGNITHAVLTAPQNMRWLAAALAVGAFLPSFVALRDLAVLAGIAPEFAAVLPVVIDVAVAAAITALVAVGDKPARRTRNAPSAAMPPAPRSATPSPITTKSNRLKSAPVDEVSAVSTAPAVAGAAIAQLAGQPVTAKVTRQPVDVVEAILVAHEKGAPLNRIAATVGVHHSAVRRILDAAEANSQRDLLAAS
jgi:hypothetical protein